MDALQVYDESPKRNMRIKSDGWLNEGQEKLLGGPKVVSCEQSGGIILTVRLRSLLQAPVII